MLNTNIFQYTTRRLLFDTSRSTFSASVYSKLSETQSKHNKISNSNSRFYHTTNVNRNQINDSRKLPTSKFTDKEAVAANDILEAKRLERVKQNDRPVVLVATSTDKFASGLSPIPAASSITPKNSGLFHDVKVANTPVSPGIPIVSKQLPSTPEEFPKGDERIPSSHFSAFLRGIRSGLPFFPSSKKTPLPVDFTTTREYFIPLTRPSLIRLTATDSRFIDDNTDRQLFHELCHGFDSAVVQYYQPILDELKHLFSSLNPDDETLENRRVSYRDRLDNEYWLLQKINDLLHRANFTELPRHVLVDKFIHHENSLSSSINVKIDGYDYDVLKFWILGREQMHIENSPWWRKIFRITYPTSSKDYFKRVILAVRLKGHDRLYIKAFRDIPLENLKQLLPAGRLQIGNFEQQLVRLTFLVGAGTIATHLIATMASYQLPSLLIGGSSLTLLLAMWSLRNFHKSKVDYLIHMNQLLFYKNIASNKQLLAMIVDRAQDELSKEVLLVYMFLLEKQKKKINLTKKTLELEIENWISLKTNTHITFNSDQSIEFLRKLGIILPDDPARLDCLRVVPFQEVIRILPKTSRILSEKTEEWDLVEGYDKKYFEVDWKTVLNEDKLLKKTGWH